MATVAEKMTAIADAIRAKTGGTEPLTLDGMATAIAGISGGGDGDILKGIAEKTATKLSSNGVTEIVQGAFASFASLTDVNFPNCSTIGWSAFFKCSMLENINFPACVSIGQRAFGSCRSLKEISFPACVSIDSFAFESCKSIAKLDFPEVVSLSNGAFRWCSSISEVNFPKCQIVSADAFSGCYGITKASFPACTYIGSQAFNDCSKMSALILAGSILCSLSNSNAFTWAYITSTRGNIFVPASLVAAYKSAPQWSYFSAVIKAVEDSEFA